MEAWKLFFLGLIQGVTEFLPISSSGHLFLAEKFFNLGQDSLAFAVFVHGATLLSLCTVFFKDFKKTKNIPETRSLLLKIIVGSLPVGIIGLFFRTYVTDAYAELTLHSGFLLTGVLFIFVFLFQKKNSRNLNSLTFKEAFLIGVFQAFAILPGFSRSGWTIALGLFLGFSPKSSYTFSFLLAFPALLGAFILSGLDSSFSFSVEWLGAFLGAYIAGTLSLYLLLFILQKRKLHFFSFYLIPLALYLILF